MDSLVPHHLTRVILLEAGKSLEGEGSELVVGSSDWPGPVEWEESWRELKVDPVKVLWKWKVCLETRGRWVREPLWWEWSEGWGPEAAGLEGSGRGLTGVTLEGWRICGWWGCDTVHRRRGSGVCRAVNKRKKICLNTTSAGWHPVRKNILLQNVTCLLSTANAAMFKGAECYYF